MTPDGAHDSVFPLLARLPTATPSARSAERIRERSHAALMNRASARTAARRTSGQKFGVRIVDGALFFVGLMYLAGALAEVVRSSAIR